MKNSAYGLLLLVVSASSHGVTVVSQPLSQLTKPVIYHVAAEVISHQNSQLSSQIQAAVTNVLVRPGTVVQNNQLLVRLDCRQYELRSQELAGELQTLQAQQDFAQRQLQRGQKLVLRGALSRAQLDQQRSELALQQGRIQSLNARIKQNKRDISQCTIRAPFTGIVHQVSASTGEFYNPGQALLQLQSLQDLEVTASISPAQADGLQRAKNVWFEFADQAYPIELRAQSPRRTQGSNAQQWYWRLASSSPNLLGGRGQVYWRSDAKLPADLLVQRQGQWGVFVAQDNRAVFMPLPKAKGGLPALPTGLAPDARIIVQGQQGLATGVEVTERATVPLDNDPL